MKDNRVLKVLWGIVLAIFLCSALFIGISYFSVEIVQVRKRIMILQMYLHQKLKIKMIQNLSQKIKVMRKNIEKTKILVVEQILYHHQMLRNQKIIGQLMLPKFQVINRVVIIVV